MKREELKKIISQIKKYNLTKAFENTEEFDKWLSKLTVKQIQNFNSLTVEPSSMMFPIKLLIDENLLNCDDYNERVDAMSKLKNGDGCWHLFDRLCSPNFLNSKSYYEDMEMISKADTARYALCAISEKAFIQSKYHKEDLRYIVEAKDIEKNNKNSLDWIVADALATVARNIDSIKSPYHQKDMEIIAHSGAECLDMSGSFPVYDLNSLAINKVSLRDKYHLENMKILSKNPIASEYLYKIMTDPKHVEGKKYRAEVDALVNAKSKITAIAIYKLIANPKDFLGYNFDFSKELYDYGFDYYEISLLERNERIKGNLNKKYLEYLQLLNQLDDKFVMFFESLLSNKHLFNSPYQEHDLKLLHSVIGKEMFLDLYRLMINESSLLGPHHIKDVNLIAKTFNEKTRKLLLSKAIDENSIKSNNHEYDMQYIAKLDLDNIDTECYKKMSYYLFNESGINSIEHVSALEKLNNGENIEIDDPILEHLNSLEQNSNINGDNSDSNVKILSKIKKMFRK